MPWWTFIVQKCLAPSYLVRDNLAIGYKRLHSSLGFCHKMSLIGLFIDRKNQTPVQLVRMFFYDGVWSHNLFDLLYSKTLLYVYFYYCLFQARSASQSSDQQHKRHAFCAACQAVRMTTQLSLYRNRCHKHRHTEYFCLYGLPFRLLIRRAPSAVVVATFSCVCVRERKVKVVSSMHLF